MNLLAAKSVCDDDVTCASMVHGLQVTVLHSVRKQQSSQQ
jgi:hypothetical protein